MSMIDRDWYKDHYQKTKSKTYQTLDKDPRELSNPPKPRTPFLYSIVYIVIVFFCLLFLVLAFKNFFPG